jgi:hypothetical protein
MGITFRDGAAFVMARIFKRFLFQIKPADPSTFLEILLLFRAMSLIASYIPA